MESFVSEDVRYWIEQRPDGLFNLMAEHQGLNKPLWLACWSEADLGALQALITAALEGKA